VETGRNDWAAPEPVTGDLCGGCAPCAIHFAEIAQQVERHVETVRAKVRLLLSAPVHHLVSSVGFRAPAYEAEGRTFESCTGYQLGVAQQAARVIWDHEVAGSRPATETSFIWRRMSVRLGVAVAQRQSCGLWSRR
jgi:hypothetical protein